MAWMYTFDIGGTQTTYAMRNITYDFLTIYAGITGPPERWYYCTELVNIDLGFPLSRAYVDEFFPAGAKEEVSDVNFWKGVNLYSKTGYLHSVWVISSF